MAEKVVVVRESAPREPVRREKPLKIDLEYLVVPAVIGGGLLFYSVYKEQIHQTLDNLMEAIPKALGVIRSIPVYPLPPIDFPDGGGTTNNSGFGSGEISQHGLQSGGSAWRKQWDNNRRYLNAEFKGYFYVPTSNKRRDGISIKMRGAQHSDSCPKCGCCYIFHVEFNGSNDENFQKECPHPDYAKNRVGTKFNPGSLLGKWTGIRCSTVNSGNGVRCRMWLDTSGTVGANQWRLWYDILDTGQYGDSSSTRPPFTKSPWGGGNAKVSVRIDADSKGDAQNYQMRNATVGELYTSNLALQQDYSPEPRITVPY